MASPTPVPPRILLQVLVLVVVAVMAAGGGWYAALRYRGCPNELVELEHVFRDRCKVVGVHEAFLEFTAHDAVYFDVEPQEARGPKALETRRAGWAAIQRLEWEPTESFVACSGELGYTWGRSEIHVADGEGKEPKVIHGHYVCIWRRDESGRWRIALDTGNPRHAGMPLKVASAKP